MSREKFIKRLQYFDENFNAIVRNDKNWDELMKEYERSHDEEISRKYSNMHNLIDVARVKQITQNNDNCFVPFYDIDKDYQFAFFENLSRIELGVMFFNDFSERYRDIKSGNKNKSKQKKIDEVTEMLGADLSNYETTIKDLQSLRATLDNNHFTKRQLFQHLLSVVAYTLNGFKQSRKVAATTNKLINDYFDCDITFSRAEDIEKYKVYKYYYTDAGGIDLVHA